MDISVDKLYEPLFRGETKARYVHLWGGRGRGGSYTGTALFLHLQSRPEYFRGYFMREIFNDVRGSLWMDYKDRIEESGASEEDYQMVEQTMMSRCLATGNTITSKGFKKSSGKATAKMKSLAGATHVLIEEAEEISEADFMQLDDSLRTIKGNVQIIMLFNPPAKDHWIIKRWYNLTEAGDAPGYYRATAKKDDNLFSVFSTYKDNIRNIDETTAANFESYGDPNSGTYNPEHYNIVVRGLVSEGRKGRIFKNWQPITYQEFQALPYDSYYGLDWGFSEDPTGVIEVKRHRGNLYLHEILYDKGLTNPEIHKKLTARGVGKRPIIADSAEPKSIRELHLLGSNILPAYKGPDSVNMGITTVKKYRVFYTDISKNLETEYQNYCWELDREKRPTDKPIDAFNHLIDPIRYVVTRLEARSNIKTTIYP